MDDLAAVDELCLVMLCARCCAVRAAVVDMLVDIPVEVAVILQFSS